MTIVGAGAGVAELTALSVVSELAPTRKRGQYVAILIFTIVPFVPSSLYAQIIACKSCPCSLLKESGLTWLRLLVVEIRWHHRLRVEWDRLLPDGILLPPTTSSQFERKDEGRDSAGD